MKERSVALFDIDRTAYEGFLLFSIVNKQVEDGIISQEARDNINYPRKEYDGGTIKYESMVEKVLNKWAESLGGKSVDEITTHTEKYLRGEGNNFYPYVSEVIDLLRNSHDIYFVTGEPQFVAGKTADIYGASGFLSTEFETHNGVFTGKVSSALSHGPHKLQVISDLLEKHGRDRSFAFGDSEGDTDMLQSVEYAVCINPTPELSQTAAEIGWYISRNPNIEVPSYVKSKLQS